MDDSARERLDELERKSVQHEDEVARLNGLVDDLVRRVESLESDLAQLRDDAGL